MLRSKVMGGSPAYASSLCMSWWDSGDKDDDMHAARCDLELDYAQLATCHHRLGAVVGGNYPVRMHTRDQVIAHGGYVYT